MCGSRRFGWTGEVETESEDEVTNERSWRGVFELTPERAVLFTRKVELKTAELPRWEPYITISQRWIDRDE